MYLLSPARGETNSSADAFFFGALAVALQVLGGTYFMVRAAITLAAESRGAASVIVLPRASQRGR